MDDIPDELLAEILGRLPARSLAACRSVCKDWCAIVPCPLCGIFVNFIDHAPSIRSLGFFSRTTRSSIDGRLSFLPGPMAKYRSVLDHRNGLLLCENGTSMYVCNPATRRWAALSAPPCVSLSPRHLPFYRRRMYLMFDPTVSLHYEVLFFPEVPDKPNAPRLQPGETQPSRADYEHECNTLGSLQWPPYSYPLQVFSSRTGRWEEKQFILEGDAAVTVSDVWSDGSSPCSSRMSLRNYAVYWRESFYVHCDTGFIMRLSLEEQKYLVIKTPILDTTVYQRRLRTHGYLGKSKHGVYYTAIQGYQINVWVLRNAVESCRTPKWELKHQADLHPSRKRYYNREKLEKLWILCYRNAESKDIGDHEWDSSDDSVVDAEGEGVKRHGRVYEIPLDLLGYHPYREIAFLGNRFGGFAYYLDNSKLQYLGSPYPANIRNDVHRVLPVLEPFIYSPCKDDLLPIQNDA